jgi:leucyl-tRNA synthetase
VLGVFGGVVMQLKPIDINYNNSQQTAPELLEYRKKIHKLLHGLTSDIENCRLNCAVAKLREMTNLIAEIDVKTGKSFIDEGICILIRVMEPFIPHLAANLWEEIGGKEMLHLQPWPQADEALIIDQTVTVAVQVNGKLRSTINVVIDLPVDELKKIAVDAISDKIDRSKIRSIYAVQNKIVNVVI